MWEDPIVREVRRIRDAYAARHNYDVDAIFDAIREAEERSERGGAHVVQPECARLASQAAIHAKGGTAARDK